MAQLVRVEQVVQAAQAAAEAMEEVLLLLAQAEQPVRLVAWQEQQD